MRNLLTLLFIIQFCFIYNAQSNNENSLTLSDAVLGYYKNLYPKNLNGINWNENNELYVRKKNELIVFSSVNKWKKNELGISSKIIRDTAVKSFKDFKYFDENSYSYTIKNKYFYKNNRKSLLIISPLRAANKDISPDKNKIAYTIDNNLYLSNIKDSLLKITENKDLNIVSGQAIHRYEFGIKKGIFWNNQSSKIAFYQKDESDVHNYPLLDINSTPGKVKSIKYPMAGQKSEYAKIGVYDLENKKIVFLKLQHPKDHYVSNLTWGPNGQYIYIAELNRDQNHLKWAQYNPNSGLRIKTIYEETNNKWVEPEYPIYFIPNKENEFITLSERDGYMSLYHYNTAGKLIKKILENKWVITKVLDVLENKIFFEGTGEDPRSVHAFSINIDGTELKKITTEKGIHSTQISPNHKFILDQYSNSKTPGITQLINLENFKTNLIHESENPLDNYSIGKTEMLKITNSNNDELYGRLIKPLNFDENKKYPVLIYVYGGPHAQLVKNNWLNGASLWMYWMAQQGYLIFTIDGRGSENRGFEFESSIFRNLGINEMKDQITGLDYLKSLSYVDSNRVALHGWSYGGFMTTSLMTQYSNLFTCGVAGGPVIDWKWYEIMYGERYMDKPKDNIEGYRSSSLINHAKNLEGNLLLIHGTNDDVVVMQHNLAFIEKCIKEGKQVDFFPYPMHKHNIRGKDRVHLMQKVLNYVLVNNQ
jgi:dipeptidyl-peptidase-4